MSAFLAPIHFWLFNKVKIHEDLEKDIESNFKSQYGDDVMSIIESNIEKYGDRLESDKLEDMIDESNIHGWLQHTISIVETRQAAILGDLFKKYGNEGIDLARSVYRKNGAANAVLAKQELSVESPEDVYKSINNYVLDGMPCDNAGSVIKSDMNILQSVQNSCLHINYWKTAGVDPEVMYTLREDWTKAFVNELSPDFEYSVSVDKSNNDSRSFIYTIERK